MADAFFFKDEQYLLNRCTKYLARYEVDYRHTYSTDGIQRPTDNIAEAWRFPIIDAYAGGANTVTSPDDFDDYNEVTFIHAGNHAHTPRSVSILCTFTGLQAAIPLQPVSFLGESSRYWSITFAVPKGQQHLYCFLVDGVRQNDPINPVVKMQDNGVLWSQFFTEDFAEPLVLERWEIDLLSRLASTIAPFHTDESQNFLQRYYYGLDLNTKLNQYSNVYRLDDSVGEVNYIDNLVAREERHRLIDYKLCLSQIDAVLRQRNPYTEPVKMSSETYDALYDQMAANNVPGWDTQQYGSPRYFLYLLRRHVAIGCFAHPKYGGNNNAAGWAYLGERYTTVPAGPPGSGTTLFDWRRAIEPPLGLNNDYHG
jgi:hypothetical protein